MEERKVLIEELFEKAAEYSKTSIELVKLKAVEKISGLFSTVISRLILGLVILLFLFTFSTGIAIWLGKLMGEIYYGFMVVAAFYLLAGVLLILLHPSLKKRITDSIIHHILK